MGLWLCTLAHLRWKERLWPVWGPNPRLSRWLHGFLTNWANRLISSKRATIWLISNGLDSGRHHIHVLWRVSLKMPTSIRMSNNIKVQYLFGYPIPIVDLAHRESLTPQWRGKLDVYCTWVTTCEATLTPSEQSKWVVFPPQTPKKCVRLVGCEPARPDSIVFLAYRLTHSATLLHDHM